MSTLLYDDDEPGLTLLPQHEALLVASSISPEVATLRGYRSVTQAKELEQLGFARYQASNVPAFLIPVRTVFGEVAFHQARPDTPRKRPGDKVVKYETPEGVRMVLDVHPRTLPDLGNPTVPLLFTEGIRKADAARSAGLSAIGLLGVWNWRGTNEHGATTALADFEAIALDRRRIFLGFDSDAHSNTNVADALRRLRRYLEARGAIVRVLGLPPGPSGEKVGVDDFLTCHSIDELLALPEPSGELASATIELQPLTAREICALPDPDIADALLGPYVVRTYRTVIGGSTGEGKTTLAWWFLKAIVEGLPLLGFTGAGNARALVIDLEQGLRTVKLRLRELGLDDSASVDYLLIPEGLSLDQNDAEVAAIENVLAGGYDVVLLDPHYKAHRGDGNDERATVDLMRLLDRWRSEYGFALILPAHTRKPLEPGATFTIHDISGSSALVRGAELVLGIRRLSNGYSRLLVFKDRDDTEGLPVDPLGKTGWGLVFDKKDGYRRDPRDETDRELKAPAAAIAEWISEQGGTAAPNQIKEQFEIADATLRDRRAALAELGIDYIGGKAGRPAKYVLRQHEQTVLDDESKPQSQTAAQTAALRFEATSDLEPASPQGNSAETESIRSHLAADQDLAQPSENGRSADPHSLKGGTRSAADPNPGEPDQDEAERLEAKYPDPAGEPR